MGTRMKKKTQTNRIAKVTTTDDVLTGRGGLALFTRYVTNLDVLSLLNNRFGTLRQSAKGLSVTKLFLQIFCFLFDGTSRHLAYFDHLAQDQGYAATLETDKNDMASSLPTRKRKDFSLCK